MNEEHVKLFEIEADDWDGIADAYEAGDIEKARELKAGKDARCGICVRFREIVDEGGEKKLDCRKCPIVVVTGHTCAHWWREEGYRKHIKDESDEVACKKARATAERIREYVEVMKSWVTQQNSLKVQA